MQQCSSTKRFLGLMVDLTLGLKRLIANAASAAAGCQYCRAHTAVSAGRHGVEDEKIAAMHKYTTSDLFDESERVAIEFAMAAASVPNGVTDELFARLSEYWSEEEIVEILGVVCMFGIFNRWNDSMATPLKTKQLRLEPACWVPQIGRSESTAERCLARGRQSHA